jgi:hypothetical protein
MDLAVEIREATRDDAPAIADIHLIARATYVARAHTDNETRVWFAHIVGDRPSAWPTHRALGTVGIPLRYARRTRATTEGRGLTTRDPALARLGGPYSPIESGAPHSSADTQGAQRSFGGIRRTAPRQRAQLLSTLRLWTYFKNASSSASSTCQ